MYCPNCGAENPAHGKFCKACGKSLADIPAETGKGKRRIGIILLCLTALLILALGIVLIFLLGEHDDGGFTQQDAPDSQIIEVLETENTGSSTAETTTELQSTESTTLPAGTASTDTKMTISTTKSTTTRTTARTTTRTTTRITTTTKTTTTTAAPVDPNANWRQLYAEALRAAVRNNEADHFALAYMDEDDIPELVYYVNHQFHVASVTVYTVYNGKLCDISFGGHYLFYGYVKRQNILLSEYSVNGVGGFERDLLHLENGQLVGDRSIYEEYTGNDAEGYSQVYYVDGNIVTEAEYNEVVRNEFECYRWSGSEGNADEDTVYEITEANIAAVLGA